VLSDSFIREGPSYLLQFRGPWEVDVYQILVIKTSERIINETDSIGIKGLEFTKPE